MSPHLLPEQIQKRKQQKREEEICKKCQNAKCVLTTWYRSCHHIYYQSKHKRKHQEREESNGLDALSCSDSGCANNGGSCVEGKCKCNRRGKKKSARNARMQNVFIRKGGSKSELLKRRRRSARITLKAIWKATNKIILLFDLDLDLKTTLAHSDLSNH